MLLRILSGLAASGLLHLAIVMAIPEWPRPPAVAVPDALPIHLDIGPAIATLAARPPAQPAPVATAMPTSSPQPPPTPPGGRVTPVDETPQAAVEAGKAAGRTRESPVQPNRPERREAITASTRVAVAAPAPPPGPTPAPRPQPQPQLEPEPVSMAIDKPARRAAAPSPATNKVREHGPRAAKPRPEQTRQVTPRTATAGHRQAYLAQLVARIQRQKRYPKASRRRGEQGVVELWFMIQPDGRLTGIRVEKSSGSTRLDRAAVKTLERVSPVDPLPARLGRQALSVRVPISYRLRG
jgi:protein TonB